MDMIADPTQRVQTAAQYVSKLAADNNHLQTGFLGTPWLLPALSKIGRDDLSLQLLLNADYPSWGFPITVGATTMWERWNSIGSDLTFGDASMNSFNHYAYGAVGEWMFGNLGGIQAVEPGYKTSRIAPLIGYGGLTYAQCSQQTPFGRLATEWNVTASNTVLSVEIPVNTTAIVYVPEASGTTVFEGAVPAATAPGVQYLGMTNGTAVYAVGSGSYVFTSTLALNAPIILGAIPGRNQVSLTWSSSPFATSYNLKRATNPGGPYATVAGNLGATNYTDTAVANNVTYYYVVSAQNAAGEGGDSAEASATPQFVYNFGFETPALGTYQYNPSGASWTFTAQSGKNGSGITPNGTLFNSSNPNAPEGVQVAFLQSTSTVAQSISGFVPGAKYAVTFSAAQRAGQFENGGQTWNLKLDNLVLASYAPSATATNYVDYTTNFTATTATHTLSFVGTDLVGGDNTVFLDNVRLAPSPSQAPVQLGLQLTNLPAGNQIQFSWPADHTGWRLQMQTNILGTNWADVLNANYLNVLRLPMTSASAFFRLVYP
jgi:hypothetical protein